MPCPVRLQEIRRLLIAVALVGPIAGCTHYYDDRREGISFHGGDAVAANKVAHMIDPWPAAAADRNVPADGYRMQRAVERYRNNRTAPLATTGTSAQFVPVLAPAVPAGGGNSTQ